MSLHLRPHSINKSETFQSLLLQLIDSQGWDVFNLTCLLPLMLWPHEVSLPRRQHSCRVSRSPQQAPPVPAPYKICGNCQISNPFAPKHLQYPFFVLLLFFYGNWKLLPSKVKLVSKNTPWFCRSYQQEIWPSVNNMEMWGFFNLENKMEGTVASHI